MRALQKAGAVSYVREPVVVRDRAMLERAACECYVVIGREFDRLIGTTTPARGAATSPLDDVKTSAHGRSTLGEGASRAPERAASRSHDDVRAR
jgi:hypothetical protein